MIARPPAQTSHFLDRLAARIQGDVDLLEPRRPSIFEPNAEQQGIQDVSLPHEGQARPVGVPHPPSVSIFQNVELPALPETDAVNRIAASQTPQQRNENQNQSAERNAPTEPPKYFAKQAPRSGQRAIATSVSQNSKENPISESVEIEDRNERDRDQAGSRDKDQWPARLNRLAPKAFESPNTSQNKSGDLAHISGPVRVGEQRQSSTKSLAPPAKKMSLSNNLMPSAFGGSEPEAIVNITIGRLEIRAVHPQQPSPLPRTRAPAPLSLDAYLKSKVGIA
jgi:hypothetical protein